jgi:hypothetical protein
MMPIARGHLEPAPETDETGNWDICPLLMPDPATGEVKLKYDLESPGIVVIRLINLKLKEVTRIEISHQQSGEYLKSLQMSQLPPGRYLAVIKENKKVLKRYRVVKKEGS